MGTSGPRFAASFDETAWAEDVIERYAQGSRARAVATEARARFEASGVPATALQACEDPAPDGTRLGGCVKTYLPLVEEPARERPFGMVFRLIVRDGRPQLEFVAFGLRHQPKRSRAPTVYAIAHRRLHGSWP